MQTILETNLLSKVYTTGNLSVKAVDEATVQLKEGEFVALVGPSGSGKTTMLALVAGLLAPSSGKIMIDGHDLGNMNDVERTRFRREKIGFTFQANNLIPFLTALENVELMLRMNKLLNRETAKQAKDLLIRLGLEERLNSLPSQLSGGQQQRVAIARSLIHNPSLVLADEPTASLDTERAYQAVQIFSDLIHEQNKTGIMVTHDLRMCQFVDKVIQMIDGKIAQVIEDKADIDAMAAAGRQSTAKLNLPNSNPKSNEIDLAYPLPIPSFAMAGD